jgi:hypothetical protein
MDDAITLRLAPPRNGPQGESLWLKTLGCGLRVEV